jgi:hypothetical protein
MNPLRPTTAVLLTAAVAGVFGPTHFARAATVFDNTAPFSASTTLTHQINYPRFLRFRVGAAAGITLVNCDMSAQAANLGGGADLACAGGDAGPGVSTVEVKSNAGQIRLTVTTTGVLQAAGGLTMPYSEIRSTSSDANLPAPVLPSLGGTSPAVNVVLNAGNVTNRTASWTYSYDNSAVYASGTYGGVNVRRGRVTYTASSP